MRNPRVIIACKDKEYIFPIKQRFIELYFDGADFEIITEEDYFKSLFSTQQKAELLVLDECLFDESIKRHAIDKICILAEEDSNNQSDTNIIRVYKYSSIKEVFKRISSCLSVHSSDAEITTKIITVTSASGGTGKTTVSLGVAAALESSGFSTLYIDAEWLQTFQWNMQDKNSINDIRTYTILAGEKADKYQAIKHFVKKEEFSYLPGFRDPIISQGLNNTMYLDIIKSAHDSGDYDCILVDTDHVFDTTKAKLLEMSDYVLLITDAAESSIRALNRFVDGIDGSSTGKYIFVCNKSDKSTSAAGNIEQAAYHINEYIACKTQADQMSISDWGTLEEIQSIAYLIS